MKTHFCINQEVGAEALKRVKLIKVQIENCLPFQNRHKEKSDNILSSCLGRELYLMYLAENYRHCETAIIKIFKHLER